MLLGGMSSEMKIISDEGAHYCGVRLVSSPSPPSEMAVIQGHQPASPPLEEELPIYTIPFSPHEQTEVAHLTPIPAMARAGNVEWLVLRLRVRD